MKRIVIIGYGNPLRMDDGLGWHVVDRLGEKFHSSGITFIREHQLLPEMAEDIAAADVAVFIDAREGDSPGHIQNEEVRPKTDPPAAFSHTLTPARLLGMAAEYYDAVPFGVLYTVTGADFGYGEHLSTPVKQAAGKLIRQITKCLTQHGHRQRTYSGTA